MDRNGRSPKSRSPATLLALVALAVACIAIDAPAGAAAAGVGRLKQRIGSGEARASQLAGSIGTDSERIAALGRSISSLQVQVSAKQSTLTATVTELHGTQAQYATTHARLLRLEAYEAHAQTVLRVQMVGEYETQQPNLITVLLDARGFQDLLEQIQFAQRIQRDDAQVVSLVRASRRAVSAAAIRLGALEVREQDLATQILAQRDALVHMEIALDEERDRVARSRTAQSAQLADVRGQLASLRAQVEQIQAAQAAAARRAAAIAAQRAAAASTSTVTATGLTTATNPGTATADAPPTTTGSSGSAGAAPSSSGFTFPLPVSAAAPEGAWTLDQGVDISAPGGTPEYAVCSGTIVLHGIGGFGPWAPVLHCDSPLDGYSYVYYGHAGPANQLPVGTHVTAGELTSEVGPGIVGISSGPHVEIGFCDASGAPLGDGTAPTMLALLKASY